MQREAPVISRVETNDPVVFLTMDDGLTRLPEGLRAFREMGVPASLFLVDGPIEADPEYFRSMPGTLVESHTQSHASLPGLSQQRQQEEICGNANLIERTYGRRPVLFRPPGGSYDEATRRAAAACGMRAVVTWEENVNYDVVEFRHVPYFRPGDIILMRFRPQIVQELHVVKQRVEAAGLRFAYWRTTSPRRRFPPASRGDARPRSVARLFTPCRRRCSGRCPAETIRAGRVCRATWRYPWQYGVRRPSSSGVATAQGRSGVRDRPSPPDDHPWNAREVEIDLDTALPTRVAAYVDGGDAHFAVDREVAEQLFATVPGGMEGFRAVARAGQAFLERVVHHLTTEAGIRQFLVTGCKLSGEPNVHDVAQAIAPESRVVYVVLDPVMLAHAHTLRRGAVEGATAYIQAKMRDTDEVLRQASATLDLSQAVAVVFPANLPFIRNTDTAHGIVTKLMDGVSSGSYVMITHHANDFLVEEHAEMYRCHERLAAEGKTWGVAPRSHADVSRFFDGLELLEPGVVPMHLWRVLEAEQETWAGAMYGAVGRKP